MSILNKFLLRIEGNRENLEASITVSGARLEVSRGLRSYPNKRS
jgi:hypothetical protein